MKNKNERGFTLVEVLISIIICSMIAAGIMGVSRLNQELYREHQSSVHTQQSVYFAMDFLVRELREARNVTTASNTVLEFVNNNNVTVSYRVNDNRLERSEGGGGFAVVADNIVANRGGTNRFTFDDTTFLVTIILTSRFNGREAILENRVRLRNAN